MESGGRAPEPREVVIQSCRLDLSEAMFVDQIGAAEEIGFTGLAVAVVIGGLKRAAEGGTQSYRDPERPVMIVLTPNRLRRCSSCSPRSWSVWGAGGS